VICEILYDGSNYWLSVWLKRSYTEQQRRPLFAYIYFILTITTMLTDVLRTNYFYHVILHGSNYLHNKMLKSLLHTSIQFFESNPSGRILNRASKDQHTIDEVLPATLLHAVKSFLITLGSITILCFVTPYVLLTLVILIPIFVLLCRFYLRSILQLIRLDSVTRSPIYDLLSSSLHGLATIRALKGTEGLIKLFNDIIDSNTPAYMNMQGAARWFALRLNLIPFLNTLSTTLLLIFLSSHIGSSLIALCLMYIISIPKSVQLSIQPFLGADILMTSTERINEYTQLPSEEDRGGHKRLVPISPKWPTHGTVEFRNYSLRHRSGLENVLTNINLCIESGQKIGIIGRTGAGNHLSSKASFALFIDQISMVKFSSIMSILVVSLSIIFDLILVSSLNNLCYSVELFAIILIHSITILMNNAGWHLTMFNSNNSLAVIRLVF
jgi:ATP-binding cassette subfamily C (CFTR/MRP) protein 4